MCSRPPWADAMSRHAALIDSSTLTSHATMCGFRSHPAVAFSSAVRNLSLEIPMVSVAPLSCHACVRVKSVAYLPSVTDVCSQQFAVARAISAAAKMRQRGRSYHDPPPTSAIAQASERVFAKPNTAPTLPPSLCAAITSVGTICGNGRRTVGGWNLLFTRTSKRKNLRHNHSGTT